MRNARASWVMALLAVAPACGDDGEGTQPLDARAEADAPLDEPDARVDVESGESRPVDASEPDLPFPSADGGADDATVPAIDLGPVVPTVCAIAAKLAPEAPDGGLALPSVHEFSLAIDWARNTAATGSGGTAKRVPLVQQDGVWTTQAPLMLSLALAGSHAGERPVITYEQIRVSPTSIGCAGAAVGTYVWQVSDMIFTTRFRASLAGVHDVDAPALTVLPAGKTVHPFDVVGVASTELLALGTTAEWVGPAGGPAVPLSPLPVGSDVGVSGFILDQRALAFGQSYWLRLSPFATDLAGNVSTKLVAVMTTADPGWLVQDGFETTVMALLGGKVGVVDAAALPIPTGKRALRFAPNTPGASDWDCADRFTARLAVAAGASTVRMRVYAYGPSGTARDFFVVHLRMASPDGPVFQPDYRWPFQGVDVPGWTAGTVPADPKLSYGALTEISYGLPPGTASEVMVDIERPCMEPGLPSAGLVIDDLRVE